MIRLLKVHHYLHPDLKSKAGPLDFPHVRTIPKVHSDDIPFSALYFWL
jgi:hypothetical protein